MALDSWASTSRAHGWSSCRATTTCRGKETPSRCSTKSSASSRGSGTTCEPDRVARHTAVRRYRRLDCEGDARSTTHPPRPARRVRRVARGQVARFRGREVGPAVTGLVAMFDGPARAVRCASAIADFRSRRLASIREPAIHTGEVDQADGRMRGIAVDVAARIAATALPGEVLVSSTVKDIVGRLGYRLRRARRARAGTTYLATGACSLLPT